MHNPDAIEPGDAGSRGLLSIVAERVDDPANIPIVTVYLRTMQPLPRWARPQLDQLNAPGSGPPALVAPAPEGDANPPEETSE